MLTITLLLLTCTTSTGLTRSVHRDTQSKRWNSQRRQQATADVKYEAIKINVKL